MSLDTSLKSASTLSRHRNVLTRAERVAKLESDGQWTDASGVLGLPKVGHRKMSVGGKVKKKDDAPAADDKAAKGKKK